MPSIEHLQRRTRRKIRLLFTDYPACLFRDPGAPASEFYVNADVVSEEMRLERIWISCAIVRQIPPSRTRASVPVLVKASVRTNLWLRWNPSEDPPDADNRTSRRNVVPKSFAKEGNVFSRGIATAIFNPTYHQVQDVVHPCFAGRNGVSQRYSRGSQLEKSSLHLNSLY